MRISICCIALCLFACASGTIAPSAGANDDQEAIPTSDLSTNSTPAAEDADESPSKTPSTGAAGTGSLPSDLGTAGAGDDDKDDAKDEPSKADDSDDDKSGSTKDDDESDEDEGDDDQGEDEDDDDDEPSGPCFDATKMWSEDYETGDYSRWTSKTYNANWGNDCQDNETTTESFHSEGHAQRSEVTCTYGADDVHRGYGGLQFAGDTIMPAYTNKGVGLDAPHGVVTVMWMRLDSPTVFQNGKWVNFWTTEGACDYTTDVLTLGLEDATGRLSAAHYQSGAGGTRTFSPNAPALPRGQWVRITVYVNYYSGIMHVWQDGASLEHVTFQRDVKTICQWHWGLYASANNDNIVLFEDDKSLWKLNEDWTDWDREPYFGEEVQACEAP